MQKSETTFIQRGKQWFYASPEGSVHMITRICIIANGTRDLCIVKGPKPGSDTVGKIAEADRDNILYVPHGDILWISITPPYRGTQNSIIMDIGYDKRRMKPFVMAMLKSVNANPQTRGYLYDAYAGDDYWSDD